MSSVSSRVEQSGRSLPPRHSAGEVSRRLCDRRSPAERCNGTPLDRDQGECHHWHLERSVIDARSLDPWSWPRSARSTSARSTRSARSPRPSRAGTGCPQVGPSCPQIAESVHRACPQGYPQGRAGGYPQGATVVHRVVHSLWISVEHRPGASVRWEPRGLRAGAGLSLTTLPRWRKTSPPSLVPVCVVVGGLTRSTPHPRLAQAGSRQTAGFGLCYRFSYREPRQGGRCRSDPIGRVGRRTVGTSGHRPGSRGVRAGSPRCRRARTTSRW